MSALLSGGYPVSSSNHLIRIIVTPIVVAVLWIFGIKRWLRPRRGEDGMTDAAERARRRNGLRGSHADGTDIQVVTPHVGVRLPAMLFIGAAIWFMGFATVHWWGLPGRPTSWKVIAMCSAILICAGLAANAWMARITIDPTSVAFTTAFWGWRVERAAIAGYRFRERIGTFLLEVPAMAFYTEQVLFDHAGQPYPIPNVLKNRLPRRSWIWDLADLDDIT